jgi:hypothetical protein
MIIGCAAFALPAWVAFWLISLNEPGATVVGDRTRDRHDRHTFA